MEKEDNAGADEDGRRNTVIYNPRFCSTNDVTTRLHHFPERSQYSHAIPAVYR
jgi:hypothetical protein